MIKQLAAAAATIIFVSSAAFAEVSEDAAPGAKDAELVQISEDSNAAADTGTAATSSAAEEAATEAKPSTEANPSAPADQAAAE